MHEVDWFGLMRGITEMHVKSLDTSRSLNKICPITAEMQVYTQQDLPRLSEQKDVPEGAERIVKPCLRENGGDEVAPNSSPFESLPDSPVSGKEGLGSGGMADALEASGTLQVRLLPSQIPDRFGDKEEEEAAAEEGALIEASGYPDPKFESNGRY